MRLAYFSGSARLDDVAYQMTSSINYSIIFENKFLEDVDKLS